MDNVMDNEGTSKAPKDKHCPYCGQSFTSSSLGRHLDLYIKSKNPKAPDGLHDVEEIRKLRGGITRRQPRGGARRGDSTPRDSQAESKRSCGTSDTESIMTRSPEHSNAGGDTSRRSDSQRVFNRQIMKSSLDIRHRVQDAIDTAKAAELALREMMGSRRAARLRIDGKPTPFDFNPLAMDFPALCLQCLESPPTLFSSTPHSTSTSWSIAPPGAKQNEALRIYFVEAFRKWNMSRPATTSMAGEGMTQDCDRLPHKTEVSTDSLERQITEHLKASFQVWNLLPTQRRQELWVLEMARSIDKRRKELAALQETHHSLKQENVVLKSQVDHLNKVQHSTDSTRTANIDEKIAEVWSEARFSGRQSSGSISEDRRELSTMVSGAIERWRHVIVASRATNANNAQRSLDDAPALLKTPISATHPMSPDYLRSGQQQHFGQSQARFYSRSSPNEQHDVARTASSSSACQTTTASEPKTSAASTPAQSLDEDSDEDADADGDEDADADVEMEGGQQYLSGASTPTHHHVSIPHMTQHLAQQQNQMHSIAGTQNPHVSAVRHTSYPPRNSPYGAHSVVSSQQMHMNQQALGHQLQTLEHQFAAQEHAGMGWDTY